MTFFRVIITSSTHHPRAPRPPAVVSRNEVWKYDSLRERTAVSFSSSHLIIIVSSLYYPLTIINIIIYYESRADQRRREGAAIALAGGNRKSRLSIYHCFRFFGGCKLAWMRSRSLRDGTSNHPDIVLKRRKWRRGTSPRALDILLEIEECIKKKKRNRCPLTSRTRAPWWSRKRELGLKDRIWECPEYDCFTTVALSCHREIVPEVILYYYDVYCNNKYYISTFYKKSCASFTAKNKLSLSLSLWPWP